MIPIIIITIIIYYNSLFHLLEVWMMQPVRNVLFLSGEKVIQHDHFVAFHHQFVHQVTANETGSAGYKNFHPLLIGQAWRFHNDWCRYGGQRLLGEHIVLLHQGLFNIRHVVVVVVAAAAAAAAEGAVVVFVAEIKAARQHCFDGTDSFHIGKSCRRLVSVRDRLLLLLLPLLKLLFLLLLVMMQ